MHSKRQQVPVSCHNRVRAARDGRGQDLIVIRISGALARAKATSQPNVSHIEHADEVELTTLRRYVEALGDRLEVTAVFADDRLPLAVGDDQR